MPCRPGNGALFWPKDSLEAFRFTTNKSLPPVRTLALHGYSVGLGFHDELEHRLQVSSLRRLTLKSGLNSNVVMFLEKLTRSGSLCLEVLDICWRGWYFFNPQRFEPFRVFFQSFKGLKKLVIRGSIALPYSPLVDGISWHGDALENLVLYDPDGLPTRWRPIPRDVQVTSEYVLKLSATCTRLRTLALAVHFHNVSRLYAIQVWYTG